MKKIIFVLFILYYISPSKVSAQWQYVGPWPDTTYKGGSHGIAVTPNGNVWQSSYYKQSWITPNNDTVGSSPIYVFDQNGVLLNTIYTVTDGSIVDTLGVGGSTSGCRGLSVDNEGNILFVSGAPSKIIRINSQTYERLGSRLIFGEIGSSPTSPAVSGDGTVFVGPVVSNYSPSAIIATYDLTLNYLGNAVAGPPGISRTIEVSNDGLKLYWLILDNSKIYIFSRPDIFSPFTLTDSLFQGISIESSAWNPATGYLWVSNDKRGTNYSNLTWYGINLSTNAIVDSFTLNVQASSSDSVDLLPRAIDFSPDGNTAYVGLFGRAFHRIYKFVKVTNIDDNGLTVIDGYKLSQNYPNPFNPTTTINFELPKNGYTTLKVYDMLGNEVATLIDKEMTAGQHSVKFNAQNLASGTYLYQLNVNGVRISNKMILMK